MEKMTILEYLAFVGANEKVKETLSKIYFGVPGGKEARIVASVNDVLVCEVEFIEKNKRDPWAPVKVTKTTMYIDGEGKIPSKKDETFTRDSGISRTQLL